MDLNLSDIQLSWKQGTREFLDREVVPLRREWDRMERIDTSLIPILGEFGFFGVGVPEQYGGLGGDFLTYCLGIEELGRADSSLRGVVSVSLGLVAKSILAHGSEEQKSRWLPRLCAGTALGCFGLTEPGVGSDPGRLGTVAVRDGDHYTITGSKVFITNGTWADVCLLFARTGGPGPKGISAFLVPTSAPGFSAREMKGKLGLRGQATAELFLDSVRVPAEARLGEENTGFAIAMAALDKGRIGLASGCVGIIEGCLEAAVDYTTQREQFGRPIASFQLIQDMIADISVEADAARFLTWRAATLVDEGKQYSTAASKAKYFASEAAVRSSDRALQTFGGYGYIDEYPVQKYLRDARVMTLYEGTSQIQKLLIGRAETGLSAFA